MSSTARRGLFYLRATSVQFVDMDLNDVRRPSCGDPVGRCRRGPGAEHQRHGPALGADAPSVFVCHAHEDAADAERVSAGLRANGFDVWLDKDALHGGDDWDAAIEQRIRHDIDYVVVLQSANLLHKDVGYVNKEINLAFDRQQRVPAATALHHPGRTSTTRPTSSSSSSNWQLVDLRRRRDRRYRQARSAATSTGRAQVRMTDQVVRPGRCGRPPPPARAAGARVAPARSPLPGLAAVQDSDLDRLLFRGRAQEVDAVLHSILSYDLLLCTRRLGARQDVAANAGVLHPAARPGPLAR